MSKENAKLMIKDLLEVWEIGVGSMYLSVINAKIDRLSDEQMRKSVEVIKKYF